MSPTITTHDATIVNRQAKRGDLLEFGRTLDHLAQREAHNGLDRAEILLLVKDEAGDNVIHAASAYGNTNIIAFVCSLDAFTLKPGALLSIINGRNYISDTPIHVATKNNQLGCVAALLQRGAALNAVGSFGFSVAHFATSNRYLQLLRYLLERGADPGPCGMSGDTPAHMAARQDDMGCLRALRAAGASLRGYNMAGQTPANIAESRSNEEMMAWMKEEGVF